MRAFRIKRKRYIESPYDWFVQTRVWYGWINIARCFSKVEAIEIMHHLQKYQKKWAAE